MIARVLRALTLKRRPAITAADAARALSEHRLRSERLLIRKKCDEMRAEMGLPPFDWSKLS